MENDLLLLLFVNCVLDLLLLILYLLIIILFCQSSPNTYVLFFLFLFSRDKIRGIFFHSRVTFVKYCK